MVINRDRYGHLRRGADAGAAVKIEKALEGK